MIKYKIKKFSIKYNKNKSRLKNQKINCLESEIKILEIELSNENRHIYNEKKNELEHLLDEKIKGVMLKAKVKWAEGEKSSKYFFTLEKRNVINKNVNKLKVDNIEIHESKQILHKDIKFFQNCMEIIIMKNVII